MNITGRNLMPQQIINLKGIDHPQALADGVQDRAAAVLGRDLSAAIPRAATLPPGADAQARNTFRQYEARARPGRHERRRCRQDHDLHRRRRASRCRHRRMGAGPSPIPAAGRRGARWSRRSTPASSRSRSSPTKREAVRVGCKNIARPSTTLEDEVSECAGHFPSEDAIMKISSS